LFAATTLLAAATPHYDPLFESASLLAPQGATDAQDMLIVTSAAGNTPQ
jgi:hypothetical protein